MSTQEPLELTLSQSFLKERMSRVIDECNDIKNLKKVAQELLSAYLTQQAATRWVMKSALSAPVTVTPKQL